MAYRVRDERDLPPAVRAALERQGAWDAEPAPEASRTAAVDEVAPVAPVAARGREGWGFSAMFRATVVVYLGGSVLLALLRGALG